MIFFFLTFGLFYVVLAQYDEQGFDPYGYDPYGGAGYDPYGEDDSLPPFIEIENLQQLEEEVKEKSITLGLFRIPDQEEDDTTEPPVYGAIGPFVEVAKMMINRGFHFAVSVEDEVLDKFKVDEWKIYTYLPSKYFLEELEKPKKRFTGTQITESGLSHFITKNSFPLVGQTTKETEFSLYFQETLTEKSVCAVFSRTDEAWRNYLLKRMKKAAIEAKSVIFTLIDKLEASEMTIFNSNMLGMEKEEIERSDYIGVFCRDIHSRIYIKLLEPFSAASLLEIGEFVMKQEGKESTEKIEVMDIEFIEPEYEESSQQEETVTEEEEEDPNVLILTGGSLEELLENLESDLLIEFYAPWCSHCQRFRNEYSEVAKTLEDKNIIIAKMNGDEEVIPKEFNVNSFPTIYYIKKDYPNKPILYTGDLTSTEVLRFYEEVQTMTKDEL